ncbi:class I SAM-dependent methyltransferase [Streptomyces sp. NPDC057740]|uniref:class I SAM-dependent methyltransferase n=1 Tax=Streptomyces sp. NPDC057740 TaxID=3346234 RepID=UPI00367EE6A1
MPGGGSGEPGAVDLRHGPDRRRAPMLPADRAHYVCTAPANSSFARARHRFSSCRFIEYRTLALDAGPAVQGFPPGSFDLVLAGDSLHATADLATTLGHVRSLLAPGGQLLATERHHDRPDALLLGCREFWWRRGDRALRPTSVSLAAAELMTSDRILNHFARLVHSRLDLG